MLMKGELVYDWMVFEDVSLFIDLMENFDLKEEIFIQN